MWKVTAFYNFSDVAVDKLSQLEDDFAIFAENKDLCGLIITAPEGLNGTVAGSAETIRDFKELIHSIPGFESTLFKDSKAESKPFKRFKTKRRTEIVTIKRDDFKPDERNGHLSPAEWHAILESEKDYVLIDTRNNYETRIGTFVGAIDPGIEKFSQFGDWVKNSEIPKEKKVLMFCTGGIRCEKAILEMQEQGYGEVYQLEGGILKYLEEYPQGKFRGECFVFDHRVAVNNELLPSSTYKLCPHCGDPGEQRISCKRCDKEAVVCSSCLKKSEEYSTCSKDCAHHFLRQAKAA